MSWFVLGSETSSELDHVVPSWIMAVGSAPGPAAVCDHGWGCLPEPFCSRKKLIRMKTTTLAPPLAPGSGPSLAVIEEANSTSPQYQSVPDFQRVQISGDYASGVGTSMAAPFPYWPPLWSLPVPQQCPVTHESVPMGKVSPSSVSPELNSLAGAVGCCISPWDSPGRAWQGGLCSLCHILSACTQLCLSEVCAHPRIPEELREVTKPLVQAGSPRAS